MIENDEDMDTDEESSKKKGTPEWRKKERRALESVKTSAEQVATYNSLLKDIRKEDGDGVYIID